MHMSPPSPLLRATATPVIGDVMVARCRATPIRDTIVLYGTGAILVYGFRQSLKNGSSGGVRGSTSNRTTVGSLTVALFVRKDDPDIILARLSRLAERADTASSKGLQDLLSQVALELLRQEPAITAARAQWRPYDSLLRAEQAFQLLSVEGRSKVDRLTGTCVVLWCV